MLSSINVVRVISIILEKIYKQPEKFFNFKNTHGNRLPPPKRENLKQFLIQILQKYTKVRTPIEIFQQLKVLSMGSALSPILANILMNDLEQKIITKFINSGNIIHYSRFVDDSIVIIHKNSIRLFFKQINNYDSLIKYTMEKMDPENKINFLI